MLPVKIENKGYPARGGLLSCGIFLVLRVIFADIGIGSNCQYPVNPFSDGRKDFSGYLLWFEIEAADREVHGGFDQSANSKKRVCWFKLKGEGYVSKSLLPQSCCFWQPISRSSLFIGSNIPKGRWLTGQWPFLPCSNLLEGLSFFSTAGAWFKRGRRWKPHFLINQVQI